MSDNKQDSKNENKLKDKSSDSSTPFPKINFATFINSLAASAFVHLGIMNDPVTGNENKNIDIAKQTIDIITMLEEKTKNNLTVEEKNIIANVLHDLRMQYVKVIK